MIAYDHLPSRAPFTLYKLACVYGKSVVGACIVINHFLTFILVLTTPFRAWLVEGRRQRAV